MVKFDISVFKFFTRSHFRVLTAIEMGMRNHSIVPTSLIETISQMKRGSCFKIISDLHKHKLITHNSIPYDGYTLTFRGYDYLCINVFVKRGLIIAIGRQIGVGKESDVFEAFGPKDPTTDISVKYVLKLHRLGRISFRNVIKKRDYISNNKYNTKSYGSWLYLSRLSALKEYGFMKILHDKNFPVPQPIDLCRHGILMSFIDAFPLYHCKKIKKPAILCNKSINLIIKLAKYGLIHCDYNEFNLMVNDNYDLILIDFPQMISVNHPQAQQYFNRDLKCIINYFGKKFNYNIDINNVPNINNIVVIDHLDNIIEASGYYGKNEQIHQDDFNKLHKFFESTIKTNNIQLNDNDNKSNVDLDLDLDRNVVIGNNNDQTTLDLDKNVVIGNDDNQINLDLDQNVVIGNNNVQTTLDLDKNVVTGNDNDQTNVNDGNDNNNDNVDIKEKELTEKEKWRLKKLKKKQAFQKRKMLKNALKDHKDNILNTNNKDLNVNNNNDNTDNHNASSTISDIEIRKRLKKKQKLENRKNKYKRSKKTSDKNKLRRNLVNDLKSDFW